jgi:polar amino acid transport system permease protein
MYADTVVRDKLLHSPKFVSLLAVAATAAVYYLNPLIGPIETKLPGFVAGLAEYGMAGRAVLSLAIGVILALFASFVSRFGDRQQVWIVWVLLTLLLVGFFYMFNLSATFIRHNIGFLITQGLWTTLYVSALSITIASIIALIAAIAKLSDSGIARGIANYYTSLFRGLPLLMQIYLIYIGLPQLGYVIDAVPAGIAALSLCYGAYMTEIFRSGIEAIPRGQWEGARAIGFNPTTTLRRIILPQAIPLVIPAIGNQFIAMLKDSSLISVIGVWELMYLSRTLGNKTFQHMEMLVTVSMIYWLLTISLELIQSRIEKAYHTGRK